MSESTSAPAPVAPAAPAAAVPGSPVTPGAAAPAAGADAATPATAITASVLTDPPGPAAAETGKPGDAARTDAPKEADAPVEVKPIEYADFALPEGLAKDDATLTAFREEAAKLGLTQDQAQALVTRIGVQSAANAAERAADQMKVWIKTNSDWQAQIKADPETGGDNFEPMKVKVGRVLDDYIGPVGSADRTKLNHELLATGAGNLPTLTKLLARIAAAHTEGSHVPGNPGRTRLSDAEMMYPTHNKSTA